MSLLFGSVYFDENVNHYRIFNVHVTANFSFFSLHVLLFFQIRKIQRSKLLSAHFNGEVNGLCSINLRNEKRMSTWENRMGKIRDGCDDACIIVQETFPAYPLRKADDAKRRG